MKLKTFVLSALLLSGTAFAADTKISDLPAGTPMQATDVFPIARAGANYKIPGSDLCRVASCTMTSPVLHTDGTVGAPSISFASDTNTGLFLTSPDYVSMSAGGGLLQSWTATAVFIRNADLHIYEAGKQITWDNASSADTGLARSAAGVVKVTNGSSGSGSLTAAALSSDSWTTVQDASATGLNRSGANQLDILTGGGGRARINSTQFGIVNGVPLNFAADLSTFDTGLARSAAGVVRVTNGSSGVGNIELSGGAIGQQAGENLYFNPSTGVALRNGASTVSTWDLAGLLTTAQVQAANGVKGMNTKTVTDASATTVAIITLSRTNLQNFLDAEVQWGCYYRDDGPAVQVYRNQSHLAAINNGGTVACNVSSLAGTTAVTTGSLTGTLATTTGTDVCNLRITCDSNLAGANPAFFAMYRLDQLGTYATVAPQ